MHKVVARSKEAGEFEDLSLKPFISGFSSVSLSKSDSKFLSLSSFISLVI